MHRSPLPVPLSMVALAGQAARRYGLRPCVLVACAGLAALGASGAGFAEPGDPPVIAARLSYVQGAVSIQPAGVDQWADAVVNRPFTTGDRLWADQSSRAELQLGPIAIRLAERTGVSFLDLDDSTVQMQLTAGTLEVHVPQLEQGQTIEVDTPALALAVRQPGDYRIEVSDNGDSAVVKVITGEVEVNGAGQTVPLQTQQQGMFDNTGALTSDIGTLGPPDDFDGWCFARDRRESRARQAIGGYVSPEVTGYEDLDEYGTWSSTPEYGEVWVPTAVPVGWAPYRVGHWVWIAPWGWTWVDAQPWGFAPFHYGRWAWLRGSWCWVPGPHRVRPVYAPALVAWVGAGAAVSLTLAAGPGVAWFPLAPRDVYVPPYRVSNTYVRNVNITNTTIINNTYITNVIESGGSRFRSPNQSVPGAVTAVPRSVFTSAQPVAPHAIHVSPTAIRGGRVSLTPPPIVPVRASVLGAGATTRARVPTPPQRLLDRPVVAMKIPPPAPVPFDKARQAIIANGGRPLPPAQLARLRPTEPPPYRSARQPPGRVLRTPGSAASPAVRGTPEVRSPTHREFETAPRADRPPAREFGTAPRNERPPSREFAPAPRNDRPPARDFHAPPVAPRTEAPPLPSAPRSLPPRPLPPRDLPRAAPRGTSPPPPRGAPASPPQASPSNDSRHITGERRGGPEPRPPQ